MYSTYPRIRTLLDLYRVCGW